jgi:hypothetical protein
MSEFLELSFDMDGHRGLAFRRNQLAEEGDRSACGSPKDRPHLGGAICGDSDRSADGAFSTPTRSDVERGTSERHNYLAEQLSATPGSIWQRRTCSYTTPSSI